MKFYLICLITFVVFFTVGAITAEAAPLDRARSPEVLASYEAADEFVAGLQTLKPKLQSMCKNLLDSQLKLQAATANWKLYSLYEMLNDQRLMTAALVRVPTVTELSMSLPKYTEYRVLNVQVSSFTSLKSGSIVIADKGAQCGPDPLSVEKGAYFMKCGDFLIGSGLVHVSQLKTTSCPGLRVLSNGHL